MKRPVYYGNKNGLGFRFRVSGVRIRIAKGKAHSPEYLKYKVGSATVPAKIRVMRWTESGGHSGPPYSEINELI